MVTGIAAGLAGPALLISLIIGAFISGFTALSFAYLAQSMPAEGGGYKFVPMISSRLLQVSFPAGSGYYPI